MNLVELAWLAWQLVKAAGLAQAFYLAWQAPWPGIKRDPTLTPEPPTMSTADDIQTTGGSKTPTPTNWKAAGLNWLFHQGTSTVLLVALFWVAYRSAPYVAATIEKVSAQQDAAQAKARADFAEALEKIQARCDKRDEATRTEIKNEMQRLADRLPTK